MHQAQARLAPQIAALHADLERAFAVAFDDSTHVLTMYASHDDALGALRAHYSPFDIEGGVQWARERLAAA